MEQVTKLQDDLEIVVRESLPSQHEAVPLDEAIDMDKFIRKLKVTLKYHISNH